MSFLGIWTNLEVQDLVNGPWQNGPRLQVYYTELTKKPSHMDGINLRGQGTAEVAVFQCETWLCWLHLENKNYLRKMSHSVLGWLPFFTFCTEAFLSEISDLSKFLSGLLCPFSYTFRFNYSNTGVLVKFVLSGPISNSHTFIKGR